MYSLLLWRNNCIHSLYKPLHIFPCIVDIEASAQRSTDTESLMKRICTVMSCSHTDALICECISNITWMVMVESKSEYSKTMFALCRTDEMYPWGQFANFLESILDEFFLILLYSIISSDRVDIVESGKERRCTDDMWRPWFVTVRESC